VAKPTGDAKCPPVITRAHEIEALINERTGTRELSDTEFGEVEDGEVADDPEAAIEISSDEVQEIPAKVPLKARIVRRPDTASHSSKTPRVNRGLDIMDRLTAALDPSHQRDRDDNRARRGFEQAQYLAAMHQLRDSQVTIDSLRRQVSKLQGRIQTSEMARERAEFRLEIMEMSMGTRRVPKVFMPAVPPRARAKARTKRKHEEIYPDGSGRIMWLTDTDHSDSDKENPDYCRTLPPLSSSTLPSPKTAFKSCEEVPDVATTSTPI